MNSQKRNTGNSNLKEENSSRFILGDYSGLLFKSSFNSVLPRLLFFFFLSLSNVFFFITLSLRALQLAYVEKVHPPLLGDDGGVVIVGLLIFIISVGLLWQAGLYMTWVVRRVPLLKPVWKPVLNCPNLATWFSYIAIWWINSKVPEGSMLTSETVVQHVKVLNYIKITLEHYRSLCLQERGLWHFWSSDLCTQWLMTADVLECSLTLRTPQFNNGARP